MTTFGSDPLTTNAGRQELYDALPAVAINELVGNGGLGCFPGTAVEQLSETN